MRPVWGHPFFGEQQARGAETSAVYDLPCSHPAPDPEWALLLRPGLGGAGGSCWSAPLGVISFFPPSICFLPDRLVGGRLCLSSRRRGALHLSGRAGLFLPSFRQAQVLLQPAEPVCHHPGREPLVDLGGVRRRLGRAELFVVRLPHEGLVVIVAAPFAWQWADVSEAPPLPLVEVGLLELGHALERVVDQERYVREDPRRLRVVDGGDVALVEGASSRACFHELRHLGLLPEGGWLPERRVPQILWELEQVAGLSPRPLPAALEGCPDHVEAEVNQRV